VKIPRDIEIRGFAETAQSLYLVLPRLSYEDGKRNLSGPDEVTPHELLLVGADTTCFETALNCTVTSTCTCS
jgi:hypothetical protein